MKKTLLALGLGLALHCPALAQQPAASPLSQADTVRAVHTMFRKHRIGGIVWSAIGVGFTGQILGAASRGGGDAGGTAVGVAVLGGVPLGLGVGKLARFGGERERRLLSAYEEGKALPHYVQRRLKKTKYFLD